MSTPLSEIQIDQLNLGSFSLEKKHLAYQNKSTAFLSAAAFKIDGKPVSITFPATLLSDRIYCSTEYGPESYSLSVELEDDHLINQFSEISNIVSNLVSDDWTITEIVKDEKIYLKIKFVNNGKTPLFKCNIPINAKKLNDVNIYQGQKVQITASLKAYFNFNTETAGATIAISRLEFEQNELEQDPEDTTSLQTPSRKSQPIETPGAPRKKVRSQ